MCVCVYNMYFHLCRDISPAVVIIIIEIDTGYHYKCDIIYIIIIKLLCTNKMWRKFSRKRFVTFFLFNFITRTTRTLYVCNVCTYEICAVTRNDPELSNR